MRMFKEMGQNPQSPRPKTFKDFLNLIGGSRGAAGARAHGISILSPRAGGHYRVDWAPNTTTQSSGLCLVRWNASTSTPGLVLVV